MRSSLGFSCVLAAISFTAFADRAKAAIVEMTFAGAIEFSNMTAFPVGQGMTVSLRYDSNTAFQFTSNQQAFFVNAIKSISVSSGGYSASQSTALGQINKYDNLSGFDGISWQVAAQAATYQFTNPKPAVASFPSVNSNNLTQSFENLIINLGGPSSIWSGFALPTSYDIPQFNLTNNMLFGFSNGSFQTGFSTIAYQIIEVPAPGAVSCGLIALAGFARRRR